MSSNKIGIVLGNILLSIKKIGKHFSLLLRIHKDYI